MAKLPIKSKVQITNHMQ